MIQKPTIGGLVNKDKSQMKKVKYSRHVANAELSSKRLLRGTDLIDDSPEGKPLKESIDELNKHYFDLSGLYPYMFDAINYICQYHRIAVLRVNDEKESHYRVCELPIKNFYDFALDGEWEQKPKLLYELFKIHHEAAVKVLPYTETTSLSTNPIRVDLNRGVGKRSTKNLKYVKSHNVEIQYLNIEFFKGLFSNLFDGEHGEAWFSMPQAFHAKMIRAITKYQNSDGFDGLKYSISYRKLFLYFNLHDNKRGTYLTFDDVDLASHCIPRCVTVNPVKDSMRLILRSDILDFFKHAVSLYRIMALEGLLPGMLCIPVSFDYDSAQKKYRFDFARKLDPETNNLIFDYSLL
jgi:hypothetical protein